LKDVVSAQGGHVSSLTPNACITRDATLNTVACICQAICDVAISLGDWFSVSTKGVCVGVGGWVCGGGGVS